MNPDADQAHPPGYENIPPRVREAEDRRTFREMLARSSLGCPCGHLLSEHDADDWTFSGEPIDRRCRVSTCSCGKHVPIAWTKDGGVTYGWSCSTCGGQSYPYRTMASAEKFAKQHREAR